MKASGIVVHYPQPLIALQPDEKLRTDKVAASALCFRLCGAHHSLLHAMPFFPSLQLEVQGGGNAANCLTSAARLGLRTLLVSKVRLLPVWLPA